jgi:hypothetical protein
MKDELITRLQNACAQRDEARAQVRLLTPHPQLSLRAWIPSPPLRCGLDATAPSLSIDVLDVALG